MESVIAKGGRCPVGSLLVEGSLSSSTWVGFDFSTDSFWLIRFVFVVFYSFVYCL